MKAAARKIGCGGLRAAMSLLEGELAAPPTAATSEEIANLAAIGSTRPKGSRANSNVFSLGKRQRSVGIPV